MERIREKPFLIVQPGQSFFPIVNAIDAAQRNVNITVFRMDDPIILQALTEAVARGVRVHALVAGTARASDGKSRRLLKTGQKAGILMKEPAADSRKTRSTTRS